MLAIRSPGSEICNQGNTYSKLARPVSSPYQTCLRLLIHMEMDLKISLSLSPSINRGSTAQSCRQYKALRGYSCCPKTLDPSVHLSLSLLSREAEEISFFFFHSGRMNVVVVVLVRAITLLRPLALSSSFLLFKHNARRCFLHLMPSRGKRRFF